MPKKNFSRVFIASFFLYLLAGLPLVAFVAEPSQIYSRFITKSDVRVKEMAGLSLPQTWWSRPYEYAWAAQFAGKDLVVLDAACGVSHPFKWFLGKNCKTVWCCDIDLAIQDPLEILKHVRKDLGENAYQTLFNNPLLFHSIHFACASICNLPSFMPKFDRIFCISTLEHMTPADQKKALAEFAKKLTPDGLVILTVDYPVITPTALLQRASEVGLEPVNEVEVGPLPQNALTFLPDNRTSSIQLWIYRCVLRLKKLHPNSNQ